MNHRVPERGLQCPDLRTRLRPLWTAGSFAAAVVALLVATAGCSDDEVTPPGVGGSSATGGTGGTNVGGGGGDAGSGGVVGGAGGSGGSAGDPLPGEKWIPTFVVKYASPTNLLSAQETANYDMLIVSRSHNQAWGEGGSNSWQTLKSYNPDMMILLYVLGPSEFNTATWGVLGPRWDWVKAEHGIGAADQWPGHGYANPDQYLYNDAYANERIMNLGNANWRQYFYTDVYDVLFGSTDEHAGADGLFSDVTGYDVPYHGNWRVEAGPNADDYDPPAQYWDGANYDDALHRSEMNAFFDEALPWFAAQDPPVTFTHNFTALTNEDQWAELDQRSVTTYAAMSEAGLLQPYGAYTFGVFNFQQRLARMRANEHVKLIDMCHGKSGDLSGSGLARMDSSGSTGPGTGATTMTGWEALWFSICAHMAGINEERNNALLGFTVWSYSEYYWFDELDPAFIHLGDPVGEAFQSNEATLREFDDGWVACNGSTADITGIAVPSGQARVIDHDNFKDPDSASLVQTFDLPLHRGVILLKEGHTLSNQN